MLDLNVLVGAILYETGAILAQILHNSCHYTPYEGRSISAWPVFTIGRDDVISHDGGVSEAHGGGSFLAQQAYV